MDRETIEATLDDLHRKRGVALAAGKPFDNLIIVAEQERLAALQDLEAEQTRQARTEATQRHQSEVATVRTELADLDASMTRALAEAEASLRIAVKAQRLHHQHATAKRKAQARLNEMTGANTSIENEFELHKRCSALWLAQIKTITNHLGRYGHITIPGMLATDPNKSWS